MVQRIFCFFGLHKWNTTAIPIKFVDGERENAAIVSRACKCCGLSGALELVRANGECRRLRKDDIDSVMLGLMMAVKEERDETRP